MSYTPASISVTSGQLPNLLATYYERKAVKDGFEKTGNISQYRMWLRQG